jgi:DNA (cytosine-5)-methyltransferase 1
MPRKREPLEKRGPSEGNVAIIHDARTPYGLFAERGHDAAMQTLDLFCGAGGLTEGFHLAGFSAIGGLDSDPDAIATFARNFPLATAICGDIRKAGVRDQAVELGRSADIVVGGPPCQAFSQVRNHCRLIDDQRNSLYREFVRVLAEALPRAFLMENVTGMEQMGVREQIAEDLSLDGEYLVRSQILDAADFGVPQTRKRLVFLGFHRRLNVEPPHLQGNGATSALALTRRNGKGTVRYEIEYLSPVWSRSLAEVMENPSKLGIVTVAQAISDLRVLPVGNRNDNIPYAKLPPPESAYQALMRDRAGTEIQNVQVPRINGDTALRLRSLPQGGNHRDLPEDLLERYLSGQRWGQDNGTGKLSRRHFYAYRKLHPDIWAWTLNTKADSAYHYSVNRALSVREFARIQSFSDRFVFTSDSRKGSIPGRIEGGPAHSRYRQVGNAVPPLLGFAIARAFRELLQPQLCELIGT